MTNEIKQLSLEIHNLLKENEAIKEYNKLLTFLQNDEYFINIQNELKRLKKCLQENENYIENRDRFLKLTEQLKSYPPYNNYIILKEELNNLFNDISSLLNIK